MIKGLIEYLRAIGRNYTLSAPTGKASKVIQEKTESEASTIHKLIYSDKDLKEYKLSEDDRTYKFYFELKVNESSNDTVYIIDEASMISNIYSEMEFIRFGSGFLLQDLFKYINLDQNDQNKKIIFIGDNAQLPPVGMNFSPTLNKKYLIENFGLETEEFELTEVVRQKKYSGILKNTFKLRKSLENKIFNQLDIDTDYEDIKSLEQNSFITQYLEVSNYKINKDIIVIASTNASVFDYNQMIRQKFFNSIDTINIKDKIMIVSNTNKYEIFLSNGDFGLVKNILSDREYRPITLKRKNKVTNIVEEIKVDLYFRDVELIVKDLDNKLYVIQCKVIENLLFSKQPSLSSDENKAIYFDFIIRNQHLKPNTIEFKNAIKSDPYFNALKIKFGYAITCHKAQGSEWKNIFLDCKSHQNKLSEGYFRWLYTALTRTTDKLYILNKPHISLFQNQDKLNIQGNLEVLSRKEIKEVTSIANIFNIKDKFLLTIYEEITQIVKPHNIKIVDIQHKQYQEAYTFECNNETVRIGIYYNGRNIITTINFIETNNLALTIKLLLEPLKNHLLITKVHNNFDFNKPFLEEFYNYIKTKVENIGIQISNIEHKQWMERYTFIRNKEIEVIDFYYNKRGQPSPSKSANNSQFTSDILGAL